MNNIEIPLSKGKASIPIIFLLIMSTIGFIGYFSPETLFSEMDEKDDNFGIFTLIAAIVMLALAAFQSVKWFRNKTGLIIDEKGITDHSNATYSGLIEWNDITGIKQVKNGPLKSIVVMTDKPEKYIKQAKMGMQPSMGKAFKFHGSPLLIVSNRLKISYDELYATISSEFEKVKGVLED
jgi:hypothetical protein